jgi:hypothetical protein
LITLRQWQRLMVWNNLCFPFFFRDLLHAFIFFIILVALNALPNFLADPYAPGSGKAAPHHRCTIHLNCEESHMLDKAFQQGQQGLIPDRFHTYVNAAYIGIIIIMFLTLQADDWNDDSVFTRPYNLTQRLSRSSSLHTVWKLMIISNVIMNAIIILISFLDIRK